MDEFHQDEFFAYLRDNSLGEYGAGICAVHIRRALESVGFDTAGHPVSAKDWGPTLTHIGFAPRQMKDYKPIKGDILVIQPTSSCPDGHIEAYDGSHWISDFVQRGLWPGPSFRDEAPSHQAYAFSKPLIVDARNPSTGNGGR